MEDHPHHQSMATAAAASIKKTKKLQGGGERSSSRGGNSNQQQQVPPAAMRKGPWTEEEDAQLVWFVRLFGERRWDFLAKVSGLRRTGKSCRLRWVNYLHPGLRRGRITADEERRIVELHAQWGSRWSRIARSLPGRTDNEIKNFWRTRARKHKAAAAAAQQHQDSRRSSGKTAPALFSGSSSSSSVTTATTTTSSCSASPSPSNAATSSSAVTESALRQSVAGGDDEDAGLDEASTTTTTTASQHQHQHHDRHDQQLQECYASDQLWNDITAAEAAASYMLIDGAWAGAGPGHAAAAVVPETPSSPTWEYWSDYSLWRIDDDEYYKKLLDSS